MAILTREDMLSRMNEFIGENNSPEYISFLGDMNDTINSFENTELQSQYDKLKTDYDKLAQDYKDRFFSGVDDNNPQQRTGAEEIKFEDLFKVKE